MAKEMMIVFVYDTLRCLVEADDPAEAVLYFHPSWVSDSQRLALCGQLMGVTHCIKALFATPNVLALQSGKFVIKEYGRYVLAVGSDRNIPDWTLKNRAEILTSLIKVYHCDLQTIAAHFPGENNRFSEKLYQMFETYLPVLQYGGYMFQSVPLLDLPKSATNIFLECMQVLEHCQRTKGVLGGTILYNNKIVATQLNSALTSRLAMVDPYRIKSPAESFKADYEIPAGAQLLVVYIRRKHYENLKKEAERVHDWYESGFEKIKAQKNTVNKTAAKEPILGSMKRDKSLLFTAVPEEDVSNISPSPSTSPQDFSKTKHLSKEPEIKPANMPDVVPFSNKPRVRPNKLALSFKNTVMRDSIDEDDHVPIPTEPIFTGQTSVCSTPMLDFKCLHGNVMSICRNADDHLLTDALNIPMKEANLSINLECDDGILKNKKETTANSVRNVSKEIKMTGENLISMPLNYLRKFKSLSDINSGFGLISQLASMRFGKSKPVNKNMSLNSDASPQSNVESLNRINVTITDPYYPVFRNDGVPISITLFNEYLSQNYTDVNQKRPKDMSKLVHTIISNNVPDKEPLEGFDSEIVQLSPMRRKSCDSDAKPVKSETDFAQKAYPTRRKSLSLPLKSLGGDKNCSDLPMFDSQMNRKKLSGVQLTPLMEKLSHLAFSEKSSGYSSKGVTPMEFKDFALSTPCIEKTITFPEKSTKKRQPISVSDGETDSDEDDQISSFSIECVKSVLYVFGLQNMAMILLIDEEAAKNYSTIQHVWEASVKSLAPIEQMCMEPLPANDESTEAYSYLSLDPQWGAVKKGGPWASSDVATMGYMHKSFKSDPSLTELIIRGEDSLVFGTLCGGAEVYYQEAGSKQAGLPTPADLMGTAPLKAKRRLQRDHSITIF